MAHPLPSHSCRDQEWSDRADSLLALVLSSRDAPSRAAGAKTTPGRTLPGCRGEDQAGPDSSRAAGAKTKPGRALAELQGRRPHRAELSPSCRGTGGRICRDGL
ncbi:hypothetical protein AAC387_Pa03g2594 [Persea americana]